MGDTALAAVEASKHKAEPARIPSLKAHGPAHIPAIANFIGAAGNMAIQRAAAGPLAGHGAAALLGGAAMSGGGCSCGGTCEECKKKPVQRKAEGDAAAPSAAFDGALHRSGPGAPLASHTRGLMESRFGDTFQNVRIHDDGAAADASRHIQAHAFTMGSDIYFGQGRYQPDTTAGQKLLAHELTHVLQQRRGAVAPGLKSLTASAHEDVFEREAEQAEAHVGKDAHDAPVRRKCACGGTCSKCSGEMEEIHHDRLQAKLTVNTPGDALEQEADHVAGQVMDMPGSRAPIAPVSGAASGVQHQPAGPPAGSPDPPESKTEVACVKVDVAEETRLSRLGPGKIDHGTGAEPPLSLYNYVHDAAWPKLEHVEELITQGQRLAKHHVPVRIEGHASCPGTAPYNWKLSRQRAEIVAALLRIFAPGISIVDVKPVGESQPLADNSTFEGRSRNRAVTIIPLSVPPPPPKTLCEMFPALCRRVPTICETFPDLCRRPPTLCERDPEACRRTHCDWLPWLCDDDGIHLPSCLAHPVICACAIAAALGAPELCLACIEDPALCIEIAKCIVNPASCIPPKPKPKPPSPVSVLFSRVRASNTPDGANDRIPDEGTTSVAAIVMGWQPSMRKIQISADGESGENGYVLIDGANGISITASTIMQVEGVSQTSPAAPYLPLSLRATMGPAIVGESAPFAVSDLMENILIDLRHIVMPDPSLYDRFTAGLRGVNIVKNDNAAGMVVSMDWDSDGARARRSLDELEFYFGFQVTASTGIFARKPVAWGGRWFGDRSSFALDFVNEVPIDGPGRLETLIIGIQEDRRSHSRAPITNSGFKLEEIVEDDPSPTGCLELEMSLTGTAVDLHGSRSNAGSGEAAATIPIECSHVCGSRRLPLTHVSFFPGPRLQGERVKASPLTRCEGNTHGSEPDRTIYQQQFACIRRAGQGGRWVRAHLLHGETSSSGPRNLHGPGDDMRNLIITDGGFGSLNTDMYFGAEQDALNRVYGPDNEVLWYETRVNSYVPGQDFFAQSLTVDYGSYDTNTRTEGPRLGGGTFSLRHPPPNCP